MPANWPTYYGTMFPDLTWLDYNVPWRAKAFVAEMRSQGIGVQSSELKTDVQGWAQCIACSEYRTCYDLLRGAMAAL